MSLKTLRRLFVGLALAAPLFHSGSASALPPGFIDTRLPGTWQQALGLTFDDNGRLYVWEKGGRIWTIEDGVVSSQPLLSIADEVGNWRDHGLIGFALDPNFLTNGYIYLLYTVDYHHIRTFGTPAYNPQTDELFRDTIVRLTRYQCDPATQFRTVLPNSRFILMGQNLTNGIPAVHEAHACDSIVFGRDGTLLITVGDSANYAVVDTGGPTSGSSNTGLAEGIIREAEDVGAFRAQLLNGHNGKVLRIDPATGLGVPSNPFYDPMNPGSPRSRVWAMGLRNPYRASLRPGTGSTNPADANPGSLYIGDVGWSTREEINVSNAPGQNFGWPVFEGLTYQQSYFFSSPSNLDAPNPLGNDITCDLSFLFRDLLAQDTLGQPSWPNPCNFQVQIPANTPVWEHTRPAVDWRHFHPDVRVPTYSGNDATTTLVGVAGSPVPGPQFQGSSVTGGTWYTGTDFPPEFRNVYFAGDFVGGWIRAFVFDASDRLTEIRNFAPEESTGAIVHLAAHPSVPGLHYINYDEMGRAAVRVIRYVGNTNQPPIASGFAADEFGVAPRTVQFNSGDSSDPEQSPLTFRWNFGDNTLPSNEANPTHVYRDIEDITAQGTIVTRIFEFNPPRPLGQGNPDPEIIRDGVYFPVGSFDTALQYDTYHFGDQSIFDYIGYTLRDPRTINTLTFQEGVHYSTGGWWDSVRVQYLNASGVWVDATNVVWTPAYPGVNPITGESFTITFDAVNTRGIRLAGDPGGSFSFISVAELRMFAVPLNPGQPRRFDATLTACDQAGLCSTITIPVWINNTPPQVTITSPVDSSFYNPNSTFVQPLLATILDNEHSVNALSCTWRAILHHNDHTHPEPPDNSCESSTLITPHGNSGTDSFYWEFELIVTDPTGATTVARSSIFPPPERCPGDANFDGAVGFADITSILTNFGGGGPLGDADNNGSVNFVDITNVLANWARACP